MYFPLLRNYSLSEKAGNLSDNGKSILVKYATRKKKGNIQEQARRRANVSQIVKNPFDYHQSYLEKTEKQDWKQIGNLFPV